jgi:O-antigen/teichoic acid export membrane protein
MFVAGARPDFVKIAPLINSQERRGYAGMSTTDHSVGALLRQACFSSGGIMAAQISTALAGIVIARALGPEQFGTYAAISAAVIVATSLSQLGLTVGLRRDGTRFPAMLPALLGNAIAVQLTLGLSALTVAYVWSVTTSVSREPSLALFIPLAIAGMCNVFMELVFAAMEVRAQQKTVAIIQFGRGFAFLAGGVALALRGAGISAFAWYQGLLAVIISLTMCVGQLASIGVAIDLATIKRQVTNSLVFGLSEILYTVYSNLPILLLSYFGTAQQAGHLAVAMRVAGLLFMIGAAASNRAFLPSLFGLYKIDLLRFRAVSDLMQRFFTPLGALLGVLLYTSADVIVLTLLGADYRPAVPLLRALSISVALSFCALAPGATLTAADRMWTKVSIQAGVSVVSAFVGSLVIMHYGAIGASYTMVGIWAAITLLYFRYTYARKLAVWSISRSTLVRILALAGFGVVVTLVFPNGWIGRLFFMTLGSILALHPWLLEIWVNRAVVSYVEVDE